MLNIIKYAVDKCTVYLITAILAEGYCLQGSTAKASAEGAIIEAFDLLKEATLLDYAVAECHVVAAVHTTGPPESVLLRIVDGIGKLFDAGTSCGDNVVDCAVITPAQ